MTTSSTHKRRASAADIFKQIFSRFRRSDDQKRSLSTGDLAEPKPEESDYFAMDFSQKPTTSGLEPAFDDCDRVPMKFPSSGAPSLMPQYRASARRIMRSGSTESLTNFSKAEIHLSQPWFFQNIDSYKAEHIIKENGYQNGTFLVYYINGVYQLVCCYEGDLHHLRITKQVKNGETKWKVGLEKSFDNLVELVAHYRSHKGFVLPSKLKNPVARPLRPHGLSQRTRA